jgi:hypothetical protein
MLATNRYFDVTGTEDPSGVLPRADLMAIVALTPGSGRPRLEDVRRRCLQAAGEYVALLAQLR